MLDLRFDLRGDIQPTKGSNCIADIRDLSQFADNSFAYIKLAAVIEHITPEDQLRAARELYRVLIPHGIVWITTPDREWMDLAVVSGEITREWYETLLRGGERDGFDRHLGLLDAITIEGLFESNGFSILRGVTGDIAGGSLDYAFEKVR